MATSQSKADLTELELQALEEAEFQTGPLSLLTQSVKNHTQVLIMCRNDRKLLARVKALYKLVIIVIGIAIWFWRM
jgi:small nuclear ribonucleoprotein D2